MLGLHGIVFKNADVFEQFAHQLRLCAFEILQHLHSIALLKNGFVKTNG